MGKTMWFLIKGTFWFSLVLVLIPLLDPQTSTKLENGPKVELGETFSAASEAFGYIGSICTAKPDICEKGTATFIALGHRAREGARIAYQFLDSQFAEPEEADTVMTGTVKAGTVKAATAKPEEKPLPLQ